MDEKITVSVVIERKGTEISFDVQSRPLIIRKESAKDYSLVEVLALVSSRKLGSVMEEIGEIIERLGDETQAEEAMKELLP